MTTWTTCIFFRRFILPLIFDGVFNISKNYKQKPRITLFYTCQAVSLYEARHDVFAYMRASSKTYHSIPLCLWHLHAQKRKTLPSKGRKTSTKTKTRIKQKTGITPDRVIVFSDYSRTSNYTFFMCEHLSPYSLQSSS